MPVFTEESSPEMLERAHGLKSPPLPRLTASPPPPFDRLANGSKHEVIVIGTGPAGMFFTHLLSYYGLSTSVLALERSTAKIIPGQADGIQPRTLEVLRSLNLSEEIFSQGCPNHRIAFWNPGENNRIERTAVVDDVTVPSRYKHKILLAAGRVVNIIERAANRYGTVIERGVEFDSFEVLDSEKEAFPVKVSVNLVASGEKRILYAKYLIGADGAHSKVREGMGVKLHGESTDYIWGVVDAVVKTDFPDIRKRCAIHSSAGSIMAIPREKIEGERHMTRLYTQLEEDVAATTTASVADKEEEKRKSRERRAKVTLPRILEQVKKTMEPYKVEVQHIDWWAAYQIGQRVAGQFALKDEQGHERVFIMGDACHTHSPKAGQGMNVSMMDGFNLAWKMAHVLNGLAPPSLLSTYETERRDIAQQLIAFDEAFASKFSQKIGPETGGLTHDEFFNVFYSGGGFTSGCGIQYRPNSPLTSAAVPKQCLAQGLNPDDGSLITGRRLMDVVLKRFTDDVPVHLQDVLPNIQGKYTILTLLPSDFKSKDSQAVLEDLLALASNLVEPFIIHPLENNDHIEWTDFPNDLQESWEWDLCGVGTGGNAYEVLGVKKETGVVAIVRPDGVIGGLWSLQQAANGVKQFLQEVLITRPARKERLGGQSRL